MHIFSVDVEDYYHVIDENETVPLAHWDILPPQVEQNTHLLLDLLDEHQTKSSFFFLGYIAQRFPHLVKEVQNRGHEIASHGMYHQLLYKLTRDQFKQDICTSKKLIEDICGEKVVGYRAPSFSIKSNLNLFFDDLSEAGYEYDSSVFPASRDNGGLLNVNHQIYEVQTHYGKLIEFPISTAKLLNKRICFFGGGYLRLFPYSMIKLMGKQILNDDQPIVFYIHPRELNPSHPRIALSKMRYFKSYVNLKTVRYKLNKILSQYQCGTFKQYINKKRISYE